MCCLEPDFHSLFLTVADTIFLWREIYFHFQCSKKLSQTKTYPKPNNSCFENNTDVLPDQAVRRPFYKNCLIAVKARHDLRNLIGFAARKFAESEIFELQM